MQQCFHYETSLEAAMFEVSRKAALVSSARIGVAIATIPAYRTFKSEGEDGVVVTSAGPITPTQPAHQHGLFVMKF